MRITLQFAPEETLRFYLRTDSEYFVRNGGDTEFGFKSQEETAWYREENSGQKPEFKMHIDVSMIPEKTSALKGARLFW